MRKLPCAHLVITGRQVFIHKELPEFLECRDDLLLDGLSGRSPEPLLVSRRNLNGEVLKGLVVAALGGIRDDLLINLRRKALHDDSWMYHALLDSLAHERNGLVHVLREGMKPGNPVLIILHVLKTQGVGQIKAGLDSFP